MDFIRKSLMIALAILFPFALAGCGSGGSMAGSSAADPASLTTTDPSTSRQVTVAGGGSLQITLTVDQMSYARGVPVQIQLQVKNTGNVPITYSNLGLLSGAAITDAGGVVVWQYVDSVAGYGLGAGPLSLAPGASITSLMPWDQKETDPPSPPGPYAPPGQYTIVGWWQPAGIDAVAFTSTEARSDFSPPPLTVVIQNGATPPPPPPPAAPSDLGATVDSRGVHLSWTPGAGDILYNIYRRMSGAAYGPPIVTDLGSPGVNIDDGTPGVTYYFVVRGLSSGSVEGPASNEMSAVAPQVSHVPPGPPGSPTGPIAQ